MPVVPIIIPFYKEYDKLRKCQAAIAAQTQPGCETFVRDNTHDNILFTAAVNEGLAKYCYRPDVRYVLVLNQDAYMEPDCVRHLVEFMDANPECGIACPIQYARTGRPAPADRAVTWGGSLQAFPFGKHQGQPLASYGAPFETHWANGACMMIRVDAVRECGLLDRNMRFICSDSDYSFTVRARGWKVCVVPKALCEHSLGGSSAGGNPALDLVKCRDAVYFADKWLTGGVYRRLAYEGPTLSPIRVREEVRALLYGVATLERQVGETAASAPLFSLLTKMRMPPQAPLGR